MLLKWSSGTGLLLALIVPVGINGCREAAKDSNQQVELIAPVAVVERRPLANSVHVAGELLPYQEVELHAKVSGYIREIKVDIGDHVKAGQLLAVLDVPELSAQVSGAQAGMDRSKQEIERTRSMLVRAEADHRALHAAFTRLEQASNTSPGLIAQQELDDARARDSASSAQVDAAASELGAMQQGFVAAQSEHLQYASLADYARIAAPFAGVITWRFADKGALLQAGTSNASSMPVVKLAEVDKLRLRLPVQESLAGLVRVGSKAAIHIEAVHQDLEGVVVRTTGELDPTTRTLQVEIEVDNRSAGLTPGMYADVTLNLDAASDTLSVPVTAVERSGVERAVFVVRSDGTIEKRTVTTGIETADRVEIRSGVVAGEQVITNNLSNYQQGQKVRAVVAGDAGATNAGKGK
jgi:RND family efflux transporter MFP subunit